MKRMKKPFAVTLLTLLFAFLLLPAAASPAQKVYDQAGLFTQEQAVDLQAGAESLSSSVGMDVAVVTTSDNGGKSSQAYADDFYDQHGFGLGANRDGLLLLIDMDARQMYISTCGAAISYYTDSRIDAMLDDVAPSLTSKQYSQGVKAFYTDVQKWYQAGIPSGQGSGGKTDDTSPGYYGPGAEEGQGFSWSPLYFLFPAVAALVVVLIMAAGNKGNITVSSRTYLKKFDVTDRQDEQYDTRVTMVVIQQNSGGGGGGSSTHVSGGGVTHGGGGRGF